MSVSLTFDAGALSHIDLRLTLPEYRVLSEYFFRIRSNLEPRFIVFTAENSGNSYS